MKRILVLFFLGILFIPFSSFAQADRDYVIGDGDGLSISVWGVPELSVEVVVRPDGKITLPAVGDVTASGLTPQQLTDQLKKDLRAFVKEPIVTLTVTAITNNKVYVAGGGVPSAIINLPGRTTLFKFLCQFGSLEGADLHHAYLVRNGKKIIEDFYDLYWDGNLSRDIPLQAEDIVFIPSNEVNKVYVVGAVVKPMFIVYRKGLKVLDAILEAGGFTEYAKENDVEILRKSGEKIRVKIEKLTEGKDSSQNILLEPGDYIVVEEGIF